jgi:hypothetical protein
MAYITCTLSLNLYEANPKCSKLTVCVYKGFYIKPYDKNGDIKYYLCAQGYEVYKPASFTAPLNALVYLRYSTGSRSHTYHSFTQWFVVKPCSKASLSFDEGGYSSQVESENLEPLPRLDDKAVSDAEAEILNLGLTPSQYDPVRSLYHYVVKQLGLVNPADHVAKLANLKAGEVLTIPFATLPKLQQLTPQTQPQTDLNAQISALRAEIEKKRKELEELEMQLQALLMKQGLEQLKEAVTV